MIKEHEISDKNEINELLDLLPKDQIKEVFSQKHCDIDLEFVGFIEVYKALSQIIPVDFTVVDLGCAYNPQCYYFKDHYKYIAVDLGNLKRFKMNNCKIYEMSIDNFIHNHISELDLSKTFAICSYVPPWRLDNMKLVREHFKNVFTFYPA